MTTAPATADELRGLLALALQHSRRSNPTIWVGATICNLKVSIKICRTYKSLIHVMLVPKGGRPSQAQIDYVIQTLGLRPVRQEIIPLYGTDAAHLIVSEHYDTRDTDPYPSPV